MKAGRYYVTLRPVAGLTEGDSPQRQFAAWAKRVGAKVELWEVDPNVPDETFVIFSVASDFRPPSQSSGVPSFYPAPPEIVSRFSVEQRGVVEEALKGGHDVVTDTVTAVKEAANTTQDWAKAGMFFAIVYFLSQGLK